VKRAKKKKGKGTKKKKRGEDRVDRHAVKTEATSECKKQGVSIVRHSIGKEGRS
jgi:hypothetical protein